MKKPSKSAILAVAKISSLLLAYSFRYFEGFAFILARSLIYIVLFLLWGFFVKEIIIQRTVRHCLISMSGLMVFWFVMRTIKYSFSHFDVFPDARRYLWYMYYIAMIFIPLLAVIVSIYIGKPENAPRPKWISLLYILPTILFIIVLTNDFHQLTFTFPEDSIVWSDEDKQYNIGYYAVFVWIYACTITVLTMMCIKCRLPGSKKRILIPCIPIVILSIYTIAFRGGEEWLSNISGDITAVTCLTYIFTMELFIKCGFIKINTKYLKLFEATTIGAQITDENYNVLLRSKEAQDISRDDMKRTQNGPVMMDNGLRLSGATLTKGYHVIWTEDMSELIDVLAELREAKENMEDGNAILKEENRVKARELHIAEQDRLYNIIRHDIAHQIDLMDELINDFERADNEIKRVEALKKMLIIGVYLKRRSNLVFLADKNKKLDSKEISLTFGESFNNLELCNIACGFKNEIAGFLPSEHIMQMYDFFEKIVEHTFDCISTLTVRAAKDGEKNCLIINTDAAAELYFLNDKNIQADKDDDGEWHIVMTLDAGGNEYDS